MKTIVLMCDRCSQTCHVGALQAGNGALLLRGYCQTCKVMVSCYISNTNIHHRIEQEKQEHVRLSASAEAVAAHA